MKLFSFVVVCLSYFERNWLGSSLMKTERDVRSPFTSVWGYLTLLFRNKQLELPQFENLTLGYIPFLPLYEAIIIWTFVLLVLVYMVSGLFFSLWKFSSQLSNYIRLVTSEFITIIFSNFFYVRRFPTWSVNVIWS